MENLNFGQAVEALKQGKAIARKGWNGKGMSLWLNKGISHFNEDVPGGIEAITHIEEIKISLFEKGSEGVVRRLPNINMTAATGSTVTGWLASQTDILAEDWTILG